MPALTTPAENRTLDWLTGQGVPEGSGGPGGTGAVAPVLPLRVALVTALGTDETPGTEVVGGNYTRQNVVFDAAANGQCDNRNTVRFNGMPDIPITTGAGGAYVSGGVVGFEIYDSGPAGGTRWWHAALTQPRGYQAGDAAEFPASELVLAMD